MDFYVTIGEIQNKINHYLSLKQPVPPFPEILSAIYKENDLCSMEPPAPNIGKIAQMSDEDFLCAVRKLSFRFPVKILYAPEHFNVIPANYDMTVISQFYGTQSFLHMHDCFEINYVFKGKCELTFLDEKRILTEGDYCILPPFTTHNMVLLTKESCIFPVLVKEDIFRQTFSPLTSTENLLSRFLKNIIDNKSSPNYLLFKTNKSSEIRDLMKRFFLENFRYDHYVNQCNIHWLNLLSVNILRNYETYYQFSSYQSGPDYAPILRYIQSHYKTTSLPELAKIFHYSVPHLSKVIKMTTGQNYTHLIKQLKMSEAIRYLEKTDYSIEKISEIVGYNSVDHFYRIFRAFQGLSPQQYRKSYRHTDESLRPEIK